MGQLQNQFQQMAGGQSPYSGGGGQRRGNFGDPRYQQPQRPQQPPMQRGIDQMPRLSGPPMMPPTRQPPVGPPPGTGGIKPQREPVGLPEQAPVDAKPMGPMQAQTSAAGAMQGGSVSQPLGQMPPQQGYRNPYKKQGGGPQPDGGPQYA